MVSVVGSYRMIGLTKGQVASVRDRHGESKKVRKGLTSKRFPKMENSRLELGFNFR